MSVMRGERFFLDQLEMFLDVFQKINTSLCTETRTTPTRMAYSDKNGILRQGLLRQEWHHVLRQGVIPLEIQFHSFLFASTTTRSQQSESFRSVMLNHRFTHENSKPLEKSLHSLVTQVSEDAESEIDIDEPTEMKKESTFFFFLRIMSCGCITKGRRSPLSNIDEEQSDKYAIELNSIAEKRLNTKDFVSAEKEKEGLDEHQKRFESVVLQYHHFGMSLPKVLNSRCSLLDSQPKSLQGKKILVLDLDETLVHSSFKKVAEADIVVHVEIENILAPIYVRKRPGVDEFLKQVGELFEVIIFTASMSKYANPLIDKLDLHNSVHWRLFRDHCTFHGGYYKKDLNLLGRDPSQTIIIDNSPVCYDLQPENAIAISSWFDNPDDTELMSILPWLHKASQEGDVYSTLRDFQEFRKRWVDK